jgi:hypothetical protein
VILHHPVLHAPHEKAVTLFGFVAAHCASNFSSLFRQRGASFPCGLENRRGEVLTIGNVSGSSGGFHPVREVFDNLVHDPLAARAAPFSLVCEAWRATSSRTVRSSAARAFVRLPVGLGGTLRADFASISTAATRVVPERPLSEIGSLGQARTPPSLRVRACTKVYGGVPSPYLFAYLHHLRQIGVSEVSVYALEPMAPKLLRGLRSIEGVSVVEWSDDPLTPVDFQRQATDTYRTEIDARLLSAIEHCLSDSVRAGVLWMITLDIDEIPHLPGKGQLNGTLQEALLTRVPSFVSVLSIASVPHTGRNCIERRDAGRFRPGGSELCAPLWQVGWGV